MFNKPKPVDAWLTLVTAAIALFFYLFAKTSITVVACVLIMFGLLVHPIWNFWWIEKSLWRRMTSLGAAALLLLLVAIAAWPEPATTTTPEPSPEPLLLPRVIDGMLLIINDIQSWPWPWIIFSALSGAGAAEAFTIWRLRRKRCPYEWVHKKAIQDRQAIKDLVRIPAISYQPCFDPEGPYIDFCVSVFNGSLFDVAVNNTIGAGYIFNNSDSKKFHYPARIESDEPIRVPSRRDNFFVIRQPLRFEEIPAFEGKDKVLSFGSLEITFSGDEISETRLNTNHVLETQKGGWRAWNQVGFICSYSDERWAVLQSGNVGHSIELEELRAKLKEKDSVAVAPPDIIAYEPYFTWIGKETQVGKYVKVGTDLARYSDMKQAAFLDLYLQPIPGTVGSPVDVSATIILKGENYDRRVSAAVWYGRDAAKVPIRRNETQTLFILLFDGAFFAYEHQYKNRPLETPINAEIVYAHIHMFGEYEETKTINLNWYVKLSRGDDYLTIEKLDEDAFKAAVNSLVGAPEHST